MLNIFRSAAYRIAFLYALGFVTVTLALGLGIVVATHIALTRQIEGQILQEALALRAEYWQEGSREFTFAIHERERGSTANALFYAVFVPNGRRIVGNLDTARPSLGWGDIVFQDPQEGPDIARALAVDLGGGLRLVVAADKSVVDQVDQRLITIVLAAFAAILVLSLAGALILGAYLRRRLSAISRAADRIMGGTMAQRLPESGNGDEFDALALSLNRMLDRIAALVDNLRQVSSDIAHDLRTPLARLRAHLEDSLERDTGETIQRDRLESALAQTDKLLTLFGAILRISEVEGGRRREHFRILDISALVREIADSYMLPIEESGRTLTAEIAPHITAPGDEELLAQALINLLDNARIHTPPATHIAIRLQHNEDEASIQVADDGPGVPADAHDAIFRRFVRLDPARQSAGHGLGLNLVSAIIGLHDGWIRVDDNSPGLRVTFSLPRKRLE